MKGSEAKQIILKSVEKQLAERDYDEVVRKAYFKYINSSLSVKYYWFYNHQPLYLKADLEILATHLIDFAEKNVDI